MMRLRSIRRLFSLRTQLRRGVPWVLTSRSRRNLVYHFVGIQPNKGVGREGMSGAIIGMHMHDKTSTTAQSKDRQQHSRIIKTVGAKKKIPERVRYIYIYKKKFRSGSDIYIFFFAFPNACATPKTLKTLPRHCAQRDIAASATVAR